MYACNLLRFYLTFTCYLFDILYKCIHTSDIYIIFVYSQVDLEIQFPFNGFLI